MYVLQIKGTDLPGCLSNAITKNGSHCADIYNPLFVTTGMAVYARTNEQRAFFTDNYESHQAGSELMHFWGIRLHIRCVEICRERVGGADGLFPSGWRALLASINLKNIVPLPFEFTTF